MLTTIRHIKCCLHYKPNPCISYLDYLLGEFVRMCHLVPKKIFCKIVLKCICNKRWGKKKSAMLACSWSYSIEVVEWNLKDDNWNEICVCTSACDNILFQKFRHLKATVERALESMSYWFNWAYTSPAASNFEREKNIPFPGKRSCFTY